MSGYRADPLRAKRFYACTAKVVYRFRYTEVPADCVDQEKPWAERCESCKELSRKPVLQERQEAGGGN